MKKINRISVFRAAKPRLIKFWTGLLPASPAQEGGVEGSYTKWSIFLTGKPPSLGGLGGFTNRPKFYPGFTLIELMVVIVILGILAGLIIPRIMGRPEEARRMKAKIQIESIETTLKLYKLDNGYYPTTEQGLQALVEAPSVGRLPKAWRKGGYLEKGRVPKDPWKNEYVYLSPGVYGDYDLSSYSADGEPGGEGDDADINSWELE